MQRELICLSDPHLCSAILFCLGNKCVSIQFGIIKQMKQPFITVLTHAVAFIFALN